MYVNAAITISTNTAAETSTGRFTTNRASGSPLRVQRRLVVVCDEIGIRVDRGSPVAVQVGLSRYGWRLTVL
jgi:hypothetical protein